ncbi:extensin-like isoform X1 [Triticum aestivum]|uniref:extensin-like isoform X1 n=1 Tax=Triticum aestivum TaxID=4565 RepID=UPI000844C625|nr:extensin-like isoform X1 [Triticum aestivum]
MLQLEEQTQARKTGTPHLFHTTTRPAPPPAAPAAQPPPGWRPSPNYKGKHPIYRPPKQESPSASSSSAPAPSAPMAPPASAPTPPPWRPSHDPWTGLVQAWPMPWSAPSPYGAPPAYAWTWTSGMRPSTDAPGLLGSRPPPHAYIAYASLYHSLAAPTASSAYPYGAPPAAYWDLAVPPAPASAPTYPPPAAPTASASTTPPPTWDQAAFIAAMNSLTTQDSGHLHHFLGIAVTHSSSGLFFSQRQYAIDILSKAGMLDCHPARTPADTGSKLSLASEPIPYSVSQAHRSFAVPNPNSP